MLNGTYFRGDTLQNTNCGGQLYGRFAPVPFKVLGQGAWLHNAKLSNPDIYQQRYNQLECCVRSCQRGPYASMDLFRGTTFLLLASLACGLLRGTCWPLWETGYGTRWAFVLIQQDSAEVLDSHVSCVQSMELQVK